MIRPGNLAAPQATALTLALYLRPSEALRLCQDQLVPSERMASQLRVGSILLHPQERSMSSKMNGCDESLRSDSLKKEFLEPPLKKS